MKFRSVPRGVPRAGRARARGPRARAVRRYSTRARTSRRSMCQAAVLYSSTSAPAQHSTANRPLLARVLTAPERYMSDNRTDLTRPTSPGSTTGAAGFLVQPPAPPAAVGGRPAAAPREAHPYDFDPWARPGPKSHAYLQLGFALARANARMLINADASRRSAHNRVRTSRLRSPT